MFPTFSRRPWLATGCLTVLAIALTAVAIGRRPARELVIREMLEFANRRLQGTLSVGAFTGSLLNGFDARAVVVRDPDGNVVAEVDTIRLRYRFSNVVRRRFTMERLDLVRPRLYLVQNRAGRFNINDIFGSSGIVGQPARSHSIQIKSARILDGLVLMQTRGDSLAQSAIRTRRIEEITAELTSLRIETADAARPVVTLNATAFRASLSEPTVTLADARGVLEIWPESVTVNLSDLTMPQTRGSFAGAIAWGDEPPRFRIHADLQQFAAADIPDLVPPAFADVEGRGQLRIRSLAEGAIDLRAEDLDLLVSRGATRLRGRAGLELGPADRWLSRDTDLEIENLDLDVIGQFGVTPPIKGTVTGRLGADGPNHDLDVALDVVIKDSLAAESELRASGRLSAGGPDGVTFRRLQVAEASVDLARLRPQLGDLDLRGRARWSGTIDGSWLAPSLRGRLQFDDSELGETIVDGALRIDSRSRPVGLTADLTFSGIELHRLGLSSDHGDTVPVLGTVRVSGRIDSLATRVSAEGSAGAVDATAIVARTSGSPTVIALQADVDRLNLAAFNSTLPTTSLSGNLRNVGSMRRDRWGIAVALRRSDLAGTAVDSAVMRVGLHDSTLRLDTLRLWGPILNVTAGGELGSAKPRSGTLTFAILADSISPASHLAAHLFGRRVADVLDLSSGSLLVDGEVRGSLEEYGLTTRFNAWDLFGSDQSIRRAYGTASWNAANGAFTLFAEADSVQTTRFTLHRAAMDVSGVQDSANWTSRLELPRRGLLTAGGRFMRAPSGRTIALDSLGLELATSTWALDSAALIAMTDSGVDITQLQLTRINGSGQLRMAGHLPTSGPGRFDAHVLDLPVGDIWTALRNDSTTTEGQLSGAIRISGDARTPQIESELTTRNLRWRDVYLARLDGTARFQGERLGAELTAWHGARRALDVRTEIPLAISMGGDIEIVDGPLIIDGMLDSLDLGILTAVLAAGQPASSFAMRDTQLAGAASGIVRVRGTTTSPEITYNTTLHDPAVGSLKVERGEMEGHYRDSTLAVTVTLGRSAEGVFQINAELPINLALTHAVKRRLLTDSLHIRASADGLSLAYLEMFTPVATETSGTITADFAIDGTWESPSLRGRVSLADGQATLPVLGVRHQDLYMTLALSGDTIDIERLDLRSANGTASIAGMIWLEELTRPVLDLALTTQDFPIVNRRDLSSLTATAQMKLRGPIIGAALQGQATATRGALYSADLLTRQVISLDDESVAALSDDTRPVVSGGLFSRFVDSLRVDTARVTMGSDVWMRSREANIQLTGSLLASKTGGDYRLTGTLETPRGNYRLPLGLVGTRDFTVTGGQVQFLGTPDLNATLDIDSRHAVRTARGDQITVFADIGGTVYQPRVTLSSDIRPPISETEIISFLLFGAPTVQAFAGSGGSERHRVVQQSMSRFVDVLSGQIESSLITDLRLPLDYVNINLGEVGRGLSGTEVVIGKQFRLLGRPAFVTASPRICPREQLFGFKNLGASLELRLSRRWLLTASADPLRGCQSSSTPTSNRFQLGADVFWEIRR